MSALQSSTETTPSRSFDAQIRAFVLDRDGTLIEHVPYLQRPQEVRLLPTVSDSVRLIKKAGIDLFLHSNQSGISRGLFGIDAVHACNDRLCELLGLGPNLFSKICIAPEGPDDITKYRKPSPLFARELVEQYGYDATEICYIGDRGIDLATAAAAGTQGIGVATGRDDLRKELRALGLADRYPVFDAFSQAIDYILKRNTRT